MAAINPATPRIRITRFMAGIAQIVQKLDEEPTYR